MELVQRTLIAAVAIGAIAACSAGTGAPNQNATRLSSGGTALFIATTAAQVAATGGTISFPLVGPPPAPPAEGGTATFASGVATSITLTSYNGATFARATSYPSGRCWVVFTESIAFGAAEQYAAFPQITFQLTNTSIGTYTLLIYDEVGGTVLASIDALNSSSLPGVASLTFAAAPGPWNVVQGHAYDFAVIAPLQVCPFSGPYAPA